MIEVQTAQRHSDKRRRQYKAGNHCRGRAGIALLTIAIVFSCSLLFPCRTSGIADPYSVEYRDLVRIENTSGKFRKYLERIIFSHSFISVSHREALSSAAEWVDSNQYPRISEFLDILEEDDVRTLFEVFKTGHPVGSLPETPVVESAEISGQLTVLTFPFNGEFFVAQGNTGWVSHKKDSSAEFAWDFVIQKKGGMVFGNGGKNENYYAWGKPVLAPAPGIVIEIRNDREDHVPMTTELNKSNFVRIEHQVGEISNIHHLMKGSIVVQPGDRVRRGDVLGKIGDSGISMFPHIHYQMDRLEGEKRIPAPSKFSCYFARKKEEKTWRLVVTGIPEDGEYLLSVDDYLDLKSSGNTI